VFEISILCFLSISTSSIGVGEGVPSETKGEAISCGDTTCVGREKVGQTRVRRRDSLNLVKAR
jgi:hypothetical protein